MSKKSCPILSLYFTSPLPPHPDILYTSLASLAAAVPEGGEVDEEPDDGLRQDQDAAAGAATVSSRLLSPYYVNNRERFAI